LKQPENRNISNHNRKNNIRRKFILITSYLILTILILTIISTLSSDYIPFITKKLSEKSDFPTNVKSDYDLTQQLIESETENALEENPVETEEIKPFFPLESPFEIYIPSIDVKSSVYEGEFSEHSNLDKIVMLKELPTKDGDKISFFYPGEEGTCIIVGHHLKGDRLFGALEHVKEDNEVIISSFDPKVVLTYKVVEIIPYVDKYTSADKFMVFEGKSRLILLTCSYRIGEPKTRFMVVCELVDIEEKTDEENP